MVDGVLVDGAYVFVLCNRLTIQKKAPCRAGRKGKRRKERLAAGGRLVALKDGGDCDAEGAAGADFEIGCAEFELDADGVVGPDGFDGADEFAERLVLLWQPEHRAVSASCLAPLMPLRVRISHQCLPLSRASGAGVS